MLPEIHQELRSGKHISGHSDRVLAQNFDAILAGFGLEIPHLQKNARGNTGWPLAVGMSFGLSRRSISHSQNLPHP